MGESMLCSTVTAESWEVAVRGFQTPGVSTLVKGFAKVAAAFETELSAAVLT
jgi:hypothetical protein